VRCSSQVLLAVRDAAPRACEGSDDMAPALTEPAVRETSVR
jgi:hypothetical protein